MTDYLADIVSLNIVDGYQMDNPGVDYSYLYLGYTVNDINLFFPTIRDFVPQTIFIYYLMRGKDINCPTQPTYRAWIVQGTPDTTGSQYVGTKCGASPLADIVIDATWTVNRNV